MSKKTLIIIIGVFGLILCIASSTITILLLTKDKQKEAVVSNQDSKDNETNSTTVEVAEDEIKRLIFIHHSTGENCLWDDNGGLGTALADEGYYVTDTNYGWGPNVDALGGPIGDYTDIGHWWNWFSGPDSEEIMNSVYSATDQNSTYTRLESDEDIGNDIIMFKSCFPNSALGGSIDNKIPLIDENLLAGEGSGSEYHTVENAIGIYNSVLEYFEANQDRLFIVITAPPLSDPTYAQNALDFNNWLTNDWLEYYPYENVVVFDFFSILANTDGTLKYPSAEGDDHPSKAGNLLATEEFIPFLNEAYLNWRNE